jgi:hypothetical protein
LHCRTKASSEKVYSQGDFFDAERAKKNSAPIVGGPPCNVNSHDLPGLLARTLPGISTARTTANDSSHVTDLLSMGDEAHSPGPKVVEGGKQGGGKGVKSRQDRGKGGDRPNSRLAKSQKNQKPKEQQTQKPHKPAHNKRNNNVPGLRKPPPAKRIAKGKAEDESDNDDEQPLMVAARKSRAVHTTNTDPKAKKDSVAKTKDHVDEDEEESAESGGDADEGGQDEHMDSFNSDDDDK